MEFINANGISICYAVTGPPEGDVVLIISGTGNDLRADQNRDGTRAPHPLTTAGFCVVEYDQRGLGQTSKPDQPYTMADYANDAAALLHALRHDDLIATECVHVVGISFGGMVAQHLAIGSPELVDRLVLCCTSSGGSGGSSFDLLAITDLPEDERVRITVSVMDTRNDMSAMPPVFAPRYLELAKRSARARHFMQFDPSAEMGARRQLEARADHNTWDHLPTVMTPTLVCGGQYDAQASPENVRALTDRLPTAELSMFNGGHAFLFQDPTAWPTIAMFLRGNR